MKFADAIGVIISKLRDPEEVKTIVDTLSPGLNRVKGGRGGVARTPAAVSKRV